MFLYHLPNPAPAPRVRHLLIWGRQGLGRGGHIMSKTVFQHCLQNGVEGRRKVHVFLAPEPQGCLLVGLYLGKVRFLSLSLNSAFRSGSGDTRVLVFGFFLLELFAFRMSLGCIGASSCILSCSVWVFCRHAVHGQTRLVS